MTLERDDLPSAAAVQDADLSANSAAPPPRGALLEFLDEVSAYIIVVLVWPLAGVLAFVAIGSWTLIVVAIMLVWVAIRTGLASLSASADALAAAEDVIAWVAFLVAGVGAFFVTRWSWRTGKRALLGARARVHERAAAMRRSRG